MRKEAAGAAEANGDFVADQMDIVLVAERAHPLEILRVMHCHTRSTLNQRLDDDGGNFAVTFDEQLF